MTLSTVPEVGRSATEGVTPTTQPTVNPWAALGALTIWLRDEGKIPNGRPYTEESSRRRVDLMRDLLAEFGVESVTAVERAARHAEAGKVAALAGDAA